MQIIKDIQNKIEKYTLKFWSSQSVGVLYTRIVTELVGSVIYFGLPSV